MLFEIITIDTRLLQDSELDGLVGFVVVHRSLVKLWQPESQSPGGNEQKKNAVSGGMFHFAGLP